MLARRGSRAAGGSQRHMEHPVICMTAELCICVMIAYAADFAACRYTKILNLFQNTGVPIGKILYLAHHSALHGAFPCVACAAEAYWGGRDYASVLLRYSLGVIPVARLNTREKCCGYWNPNPYDTSLTDVAGIRRRSLACSIIFCCIYSDAVLPVSCLIRSPK